MRDQLPSAPKDRADQLRDAPMATLLMVPASANAKALEDKLLEITEDAETRRITRQRRRRESATQSLRSTISAFVADLVQHSVYEPSDGFCYRAKDRSSFSDTVASSRNFELVATIWQALGYIEAVGGFQPTEEFDGGFIKTRGWATRYRALAPLLTLAESFAITPSAINEHYASQTDRIFPIELRAKKQGQKPNIRGKRLRIDKSDPRISALAADVQEINTFLLKHTFNLEEPPMLKRIFNNGDQSDFDWNQGGRLQALGTNNFQMMPSEDRKQITIDGSPTVELDIRASQLTIAYALSHEDLPKGDLYEIEGIPRGIVKGLVTAMLGKGERPKRWPEGMRKSYQTAHGSPINKDFALGKVVNLVLEKHPLLARLKTSGLSVHRLQFVESQFILSAMLKLIREYKTPSLPVYDCLIVKDSNEGVALRMLGEAFFNELGVVPGISKK